jgi:thiamine biosynthesis lipoprotein
MVFRTKIVLSLLACLFFPQSVPAAESDLPVFEVSSRKYLLGTQVDITALHPDVIKCKKACYAAFQEIERIERLLSSHSETSEISAINREAGAKPVKVSLETFSIIRRAIRYAEMFEGSFDVTIGPVTQLWGFHDDSPPSIPEETKLTAMLQLVNFKRVLLNQADTTVFLEVGGMQLDLGGIAKGYAVDKAAEVLKQNGIKHFLINAGGDIFASGRKTENKKWTVGIQHPRKPNDLLATFEMSDLAVATSGDYERYFDEGGKRYHHIIDPKTGYPADLNQSVTVFAPSVEEADVWATYLFILGYEEYQQRKDISPVESLFVARTGKVRCADSLKKEFKLSLIY